MCLWCRDAKLFEESLSTANQALGMYSKILRSITDHPAISALWELQGDVHMETGDYCQAVKCYKLVLWNYPLYHNFVTQIVYSISILYHHEVFIVLDLYHAIFLTDVLPQWCWLCTTTMRSRRQLWPECRNWGVHRNWLLQLNNYEIK